MGARKAEYEDGIEIPSSVDRACIELVFFVLLENTINL